MAKQHYLSLQPSELAVVHAASTIYAAYISSGRVNDGEEKTWMEKSIREAIQIAKTADAAIQSDGEAGI